VLERLLCGEQVVLLEEKVTEFDDCYRLSLLDVQKPVRRLLFNFFTCLDADEPS
jgi:hypothetical protein